MSIKLKITLKRFLYEKDMTAAQLARATLIPPQTLNNWLSGQEPKSLNQLRRIADYLYPCGNPA